MPNMNDDIPPCDGCNESLKNTYNDSEIREWGERQRRFLDAYQETHTIAKASRLAGIHRATVYRWQADPAFADAMRAATELFFQSESGKVGIARDRTANVGAKPENVNCIRCDVKICPRPVPQNVEHEN